MKKKRGKEALVNNTEIPEFAIERFARCVFDDIRADYENPEIRAEFLRWLAEREEKTAVVSV